MSKSAHGALISGGHKKTGDMVTFSKEMNNFEFLYH